MFRDRFKPFVYGLLAIAGLIGVATLVWSAIPQGAPVLYTATDTATVPILISPDLRSTGAFSASGSVVFSGIITPTALSGSSTNDYTPTGFATAQALKLTSAAAHTITGLSAATSGTWKTIYNGNAIGGFSITLAAESTSSAAANRFALMGSLVLPPQSGVQLQYEGSGTTGRWRTGSRVFLMTTVLANQPLAASATVQHSGRADAIEIVQISSSTGVGITNVAATRILAGVQDGQLILLQGTSATATYTIPDGNGVKWATGSSVLFDDRQSRLMEYSTTVGAWREAVTGAGGGGGGGTAASTTYAPTGGISATNVQTAISELDSEAEKLANKNANNGYLGLTAAGDMVWDKDGYTAEPALSASSAIDANTRAVRTIGIEGSSTAVTLGAANPRITGCTTATGSAGRNGTRLVLRGTHPTRTVTIPTGNGVQLAGNTGSVIVGSLLSAVEFECDETAQLWVQILVPSAQQVYNVGRSVSIFTCGNALNPVFDGGSNTTLEFCLDASGRPGWKALVAGAATDSVVQLSATKKFSIMKSDLTTELFSVTDAGAVSGLSTQQSITGGMINVNADCDPSVVQKQFMALNGRTGGDPFAETDSQVRWPFAQTFTRLAVRHSIAMDAGRTATWRIRKNTTDTALTCQVTPGQTECTGTTPVSIAQNDLVSIVYECLGTSGFIGTDRSYSWSVTAQ